MNIRYKYITFDVLCDPEIYSMMFGSGVAIASVCFTNNYIRAIGATAWFTYFSNTMTEKYNEIASRRLITSLKTRPARKRKLIIENDDEIEENMKIDKQETCLGENVE